MAILKNKVFLTVTIAVIVIFAVYFGDIWQLDIPQTSNLIDNVEPSTDSTSSPQATVSSSAVPALTKKPNITKVPVPTGDNRTTFIDEAVPWSLLLGRADCQLQGEVKFLNHNTYDNQDARLTYSGIDHPGRNIIWTITPLDEISVGPNLFNKLVIPSGESLLGITLPGIPKYKNYELTAKIQYGRLVDEKGDFVTAGGNVKVFEKQCSGKTTIALPD